MENRRVSIIGWLPFSIRLIYYTNVCSWRRTPDYNSDRGWFINHIADVISIPGSKHDWSRLRGKNHANSPCLIIDVAWKIKSLKGGKIHRLFPNSFNPIPIKINFATFSRILQFEITLNSADFRSSEQIECKSIFQTKSASKGNKIP